MNKIEKDNLVYLTFDIFKDLDGFKHAFSSKLGGVSQSCFESLNLGFTVGDDRQNVLDNYKIFCDAVGVRPDNIVFGQQVHKTNVYHVTEKDRGKGILRKSDILEIDALITNVPNISLVTFHADCVPLYFVDPVNSVIGLAHAGWRGTVAKIGSNVIKEMQDVYGSDPNNILAGIGPSISKCCFEVDVPVYEEFARLECSEDCITKAGTDKYYIDLQKVNRQILIQAGLLDKNIETSNICTKCNTDLFYSHRVMGVRRGTMIALMEIQRL